MPRCSSPRVRRARPGRGPSSDSSRASWAPAWRSARRSCWPSSCRARSADEAASMTAFDPLLAAATFAVALVVVVAGFLVVTTYNDVVGLRLRIDKAWANIDVILRQRHDQLPALVDAVRGELAFERDVLEEVTRRRAGYSPEAPIPAQATTSE